MYNTRTTFSPQRFVPDRNPENDWIKYVKEDIDQPGLIVKEVDELIGKGVFTERKFRTGSFLLEYHGEVISKEEANKRECSYPTEYGSFLLYFKSGRSLMCVDATFSSRIGRFVNDGIGDEKNAELRVVRIEKKPHVVLFACKNICQGEEIRFDYGVKKLPWRSACMSNNETEKKSMKQNHLVKECTVSLRALDLGAKEWYYEKEDGTSSCVKISGYHPLPSSDKKEKDNAEGHIRCKREDNNTIYETNTSLDTDSSNDRKLLLVEKTIDSPDPKNENPSCQGYFATKVYQSDLERNSVSEEGIKFSTSNDEETTDQHASTSCFATKIYQSDLERSIFSEEGIKFSTWNDEEITDQNASTSLTDGTSSLTLEETTSSQERISEIRLCSDEKISGNTHDLPCYFATKIYQSDLERRTFSGEGIKLSTSNDEEITDQHASTSLGDGTASLTLEEMTASQEPINEIRHCSDEETSGYTPDLPCYFATKVYQSDLERSTFKEEGIKFSTSNDGEITDQHASTSLGDGSASLTLEEMTASQEPINEIRSDEETSGYTPDLPCYFATKVYQSDLERNTFSEEGIKFSTSNDEEITDQHASTSTDNKEANKDGNSANEEEDNIHYYISVEEGHSSTPENAIEMKIEIIKAKGISVNVPPLEMELEKATESQPSKIEPVGHIKSNSKVKKPHRPCPFCYCFKSALSKHIVKMHSDKIEVKSAMKLPKQDRNRAFQLLKRKGIMLANMKTVSSGSSASKVLLRERSKQSLQESELIYCSKCFGFFKKKYFNRHRRSCFLNEKSTYLPHAVKPEIGVPNSEDDEKFVSEILGSFHGDEVGRICKTDTEIVSYGKKKFRKLLTKRNSEKYEDKKSSIRSEMRRIGHLYSEFRQTENSVNCSSSLDMLKSENFYLLEEAIERVTTKDDGTIKNGLRKEIGYSIKRLCNFLFGKFSVENQKENRKQVEDFLNVFNFFWSDIFGEAESSIVLQRQTQLRKPLNLPKQSEVQKLREFTLTELQKLTASEYEFIATSDYIKLRNLVASRLTLFNARRGGEPCCLQISQWIEAENNVWLGESNSTECKDPVEQSLLKKFKIAYQVGKGQRLVPLLILDDCWEGIRKLIDPVIREQAGVHRENVYVFPHTQYSLKHVGGWVVVTECCNQAGLHKNITATGMRHYVSTLYASLDMKESERQTFFNHMGHSEMINKNVYQSPLARQTIVRVGKFLEQIDQGEVSLTTSNVSGERDTVTANCSHASSEGKDQISDLTRVVNHTEGRLNVDLNKKEDHNCGECISTCQKSPKIERRYKLWSIEDTEVIKTYFSQYILSSGNLETNRGPLPGVEELKSFIAEFPNLLKGHSNKEKIARLRTKIFNERKLTREKLRKAAGKEKQLHRKKTGTKKCKARCKTGFTLPESD